MRIINLTQHTATPDQKRAGLEDLHEDAHNEIRSWITFSSMPTPTELKVRAEGCADACREYGRNQNGGPPKYALIGGAPFFQPYLAQALRDRGIIPLYAFSQRVTEEIDGVKKSVFKHEGFLTHFEDDGLTLEDDIARHAI
jgi:hypothetical protein